MKYSLLDETASTQKSFYRIAARTNSGELNYTNNIIIEATTGKGLIVSPNPATELVTIENVDEAANVIVLNTNGQDVSSLTGKTYQNNRIKLDIRKLPSGMYIIHCGKEKISFTKL